MKGLVSADLDDSDGPRAGLVVMGAGRRRTAPAERGGARKRSPIRPFGWISKGRQRLSAVRR
jgi:hypothetical protein